MPPRKNIRAVKQNKAERLADTVADAVDAGAAAAVETVDFSDPARPKTCLEIDFPILPVNQVAVIEGNASKPIYQLSKWWARRRSSVFRSILLAAATRAPDDPTEAAKAVWESYYKNHQKLGALKHLKVADIFMGGGTTLVEGSRLGMQMFGNDLNPVAWFVVKAELAQVKREEVEALLIDIEAEVKPQIMPFYACDGPGGERGSWTRIADGKVMGKTFDSLALKPDERKDYRYEGPEIIYVFWAKHGPCQRTACGHRTPIFSSPVIAVKTISVKAWPCACEACGAEYDVEEVDARMAPDVPLVIAKSEKIFTPREINKPQTCPSCGHKQRINLGDKKGTKKKVELTLLVHPEWLAGEASTSRKGESYGGSVTDSAVDTQRWNQTRAKKMRMLEVRGPLPRVVECPETGVEIDTEEGTVPKKSHYECRAPTCGTVQDILDTVKASGKSGPVAAYAVQAYSPKRDRDGAAYGGRFFAPVEDTSSFDAAHREWEERKNTDLAAYWPRSELPYGFMTHSNNGGLPNHGYTHWWTMFNPRQLLTHALLLRSIQNVGGEKHRWETREYVLGAFQQSLRNQCMFSFWHLKLDKLAPALSNSNFHPKSNVIEVGVFCPMGYGPWSSTVEPLRKTLTWRENPWELVSNKHLAAKLGKEAQLSGMSQKTRPGDPVLAGIELACGSSTDLSHVADESMDLVITDPPFGGLLHYSELSDFFYVWLRLVLKTHYPDYFTAEYTPKILEVVSNRARQPENPDAYYEKLLTLAWKQAHRILKPGGILAFTFHHGEDSPWVTVLESLFEADFYLEATYPIRSDETKGEGSKPGTFGSQQIEFDIIHVCRKRRELPEPVSWAKMRRQVVDDIRSLKQMLEHHQRAGLQDADLQVIRRGKALEYYSRHYGQVRKASGEIMTVREAMAGINVLLDEESGGVKQPPPGNCDPMTRQFLRIFHGVDQVPRDQMQKYLRGTSVAPSQFEELGWCFEKSKVFHMTSPLEVARAWVGKPRQQLTSDYDQAALLIGASFDDSGINVQDTLNNKRFQAHPALDELVQWFVERGPTPQIRTAAQRAATILRTWHSQHTPRPEQQLGLNLPETVS